MKKLLFLLALLLVWNVSVEASDLSPALFSASLQTEEKEIPYPRNKAYPICRLNVRSGPNTDCTRLYTLEAGEPVEVKAYEGDWADIDTGYCYAGYLTGTYEGYLNLHAEDLISARYLGYAYSQIFQLPEPVLEAVRDYEIFLCQKVPGNFIGEEGKKLTVNGRTRTSRWEKRIWLLSSMEAMEDTLFHEAGHAWDQSRATETGTFFSEEGDFLEAFISERPSYPFQTHKANISNAQEYFAETFKELQKNPEAVKKFLPETYAVINEELQKRE